jgi:capsular exopolysaccharide synthesis family protein
MAGVFGIVVSMTLLSIHREVPVYQAEGELLLKQDRSDLLTGLKTSDDLEAVGEKVNPLSTEAKIILSRPVAEKVIKELNLKDEEGNPTEVEKLLAGLSVEPISKTDILKISYQGKDPEEAAAIVNRVIDVYKAEDLLNKQSKTKEATQFISEQLPQLKANVHKADAALRQFKEKNRVVDLAKEEASAVEIIAKLDQEIAQAKAQLAEATSRKASLQQKIGMDADMAVVASSLSQSPGVQQIVTELQELQGELSLERTRYKPGYVSLRNLERKEAALKALLQKRAGEVIGSPTQIPIEDFQIGPLKQNLIADLVNSEIEIAGLSSNLKVLTDVQGTYKQRSRILPKLEETQRELERRLEAAQSTYELLLQKLGETRVSENQNVDNLRVISMAVVPTSPIASKKKIILAVGAVGGIVLGMAVAFLLDLMDQSVKNVKEAKELFGYTLLGVIPAVGNSSKTRLSFGGSEMIAPKLIVRDRPGSFIAQSYQMLQANLKFLSSDKQIKSMVVTSSVPKEGKSEVCANLAVALAEVERRVLLVDGNLHFPSLHHVWDLTNSVGLSNILVGEAKFETTVKEVMPGLDLLTAGVIPPNPISLLDSKRMAALIESFVRDYDCVIFDMPPLAGIADAAILGSMTDGILLVVRPGVVDSSSARAAKDFLLRSGQNVLGLVANGVNIQNEPESYFYYRKENDDPKPTHGLEEEEKSAVSEEKGR